MWQYAHLFGFNKEWVLDVHNQLGFQKEVVFKERDFMDVLSKLGADGWELVCQHYKDDYILKRRLD